MDIANACMIGAPLPVQLLHYFNVAVLTAFSYMLYEDFLVKCLVDIYQVRILLTYQSQLL